MLFPSGVSWWMKKDEASGRFPAVCSDFEFSSVLVVGP